MKNSHKFFVWGDYLIIKVSIPLRGIGYEKHEALDKAEAFALAAFPSPCGELVMKNLECYRTRGGGLRPPFPSPCGELVMKNMGNGALLSTSYPLVLLVSIPLRGIGYEKQMPWRK
jgi:hypothetical protein